MRRRVEMCRSVMSLLFKRGVGRYLAPEGRALGKLPGERRRIPVARIRANAFGKGLHVRRGHDSRHFLLKALQYLRWRALGCPQAGEVDYTIALDTRLGKGR